MPSRPNYGHLDTSCPVNWDYPGNRGIVLRMLATDHAGWFGGVTARDLVGLSGRRGNDGTLANGPLWTPTPNGMGLTFSGASSQYVNIATPPFDATSTAFGASAWINRDAGNLSQGVFEFPATAFGYSTTYLYLDPVDSSKICAARYTSSGTHLIVCSTTGAVPAGVWTQVSWSLGSGLSASGVHIYVNGREVTYSLQQNGTGAANGPTTSVRPGSMYGKGADFSLWARELSAADAVINFDQSRRGNPDAFRWVKPWSFGTTVAGGSTSDGAGSSSLTFTPSATGSSLADATGSSPITFGATSAGASSADAAGSSPLAFGASAAGSALADAAGPAALTFGATATGASLADATGTSPITFGALASAVGNVDADGSSSLAFSCAAVGNAAVDGSGSAGLTFGAAGDGAALTDGSAVSALAFAAAAAGSSLAAAVGSAALVFGCAAAGVGGSATARPRRVFRVSGRAAARFEATGRAAARFEVSA